VTTDVVSTRVWLGGRPSLTAPKGRLQTVPSRLSLTHLHQFLAYEWLTPGF